jgi:hypothetical protein
MHRGIRRGRGAELGSLKKHDPKERRPARRPNSIGNASYDLDAEGLKWRAQKF